MKIPLAERVRPKKLSDYIGQQHLIGVNGVITKSLQSGFLPSMILWGPPGIGKTTLAEIIAKESKRPFYMLSAVNSGIKDVKEVLEKSKSNQGLFTGKAPILFIDEIHRFNKSQQDSLLGAVEKGIVTLIGATTENPSFEVVSALLSRCQVYTLNSFSTQDLRALLERAIITDYELQKKSIRLVEIDALVRASNGDGRKILNCLELVVESVLEDQVEVTNDKVLSVLPNTPMSYDKNGEQHYDIASALIKSIRGSDPNAAVYWLARMIEGGEDVKFIARRLLIAASEDIGMANPTAFIMANNTFQAVSVIGYPESRIILSQCAIYLATSPKSNSCYKAIGDAQNLVKRTGSLSVPLHLRNAPTQLMKDMSYGKEYKYAHDYEGGFIVDEFLPKGIENTILFRPSSNLRENQIKVFLQDKWKGKYEY